MMCFTDVLGFMFVNHTDTLDMDVFLQGSVTES